VTLVARIASFTSTGSSTMRLPDVRSAILPNAPDGNASCGHGISRSADALSSSPNRSGRVATTIVRSGTGAFRCASMLFKRASAWLLSQVCARKTASSPNRTAKPIMTMVLVRNFSPLSSPLPTPKIGRTTNAVKEFNSFVAIIDPRRVWN